MSAVVKRPQPQAALEQSWPRLRVVCITQLHDLLALEAAWQALAERAVEPNVFYEPWMMLPALLSFHSKSALEIYTVYADFLDGSRLVAFLPFERETRAFGWRTRRRRLLRYPYCSLCTPLLDPDFGGPALMELLPILLRSGGVYACRLVGGGGPVMQAFTDAMRVFERRLKVGMSPSTQPMPALSAEAYLAEAFRPQSQEIRQQWERQLREQGSLLYDSLRRDDPLDFWINEFLALEAGGKQGVASRTLAAPEHARFFRQVCLQAYARGRLEMHALRLNGKALAYLCCVSTGDQSHPFRAVCDERFSRYAPGVLLAAWRSCMRPEREELMTRGSDAESKRRLAMFQIP